MHFLLILPIALALAMDAFAVSVGISSSLGGISRRQTFRLAFFFGFFQFVMPVIGWLAGVSIQSYIQSFDHWVASGLLFFVGSRMVYESFQKGKKAEKKKADPTKGFHLVLLSVATSIDALVVGLSFAVLDVVFFYPAIIIGLVAFLMTYVGAQLGPMLGKVVGKRAELLGGMVLVLIGIKILSEHL